VDWTAPINAYCERTDASYWSEPVNAFSNLAFLVAAVAAYWLWRQRGARDLPALLLIVIVFVVGVGSYLFHTHANRWSLLADVIPIMIFIYGYFFLALRRMVGLGIAATIGVLAGFFVLSFGFGMLLPPGFLNGSGSYLPALFALMAVAAVLHGTGHPSAGGLFAAAGVFIVSLTFRTIDHTVCEVFPIGTHFLWHMLNGLLLFMLIATMIRAREFSPALRPTARAAA
jgi:hypothetical protein